MDKNKRKLIFQSANEKWGKTAQTIKAVEELSELQVQIAKYLNGDNDGIDCLVDEIADAKIVIEQLEINLGVELLVNKRMDFKMKQLKDIIKNG